MLAYTDGLVEARREGELFGSARLGAPGRRLGDAPGPDALVRAVHEEIAGWAGGLTDDAVALALRRPRPDGRCRPGRAVEWRACLTGPTRAQESTAPAGSGVAALVGVLCADRHRRALARVLGSGHYANVLRIDAGPGLALSTDGVGTS